jgi:hypothetical protein
MLLGTSTLMVRSIAKRCVSNHEAPAPRRITSGPASFETPGFALRAAPGSSEPDRKRSE